MLYRKLVIANLLFCLISFFAIAQKTAQDMQKIVGRTLLDQKLWQQSKMPIFTTYKDNYSYTLPLYRNSIVPYNLRSPAIPGGYFHQPVIRKMKTPSAINYRGLTAPVKNHYKFEDWKKNYSASILHKDSL